MATNKKAKKKPLKRNPRPTNELEQEYPDVDELTPEQQHALMAEPYELTEKCTDLLQGTAEDLIEITSHDFKLPPKKTVKGYKPSKPKKGVGRPRVELDFKKLDALCKLQCTAEECSAVLGMDADTLSLRIKEKFGINFSEYFAEKRLAGNISLRRAQFLSAVKGNHKMQQWLGMQYLGQSEKSQVKNETNLNVNGVETLQGSMDKIFTNISHTLGTPQPTVAPPNESIPSTVSPKDS